MNHDMLRLSVKRLRDALSSKSDEVFTLENRAAQLELSIEARKREIEASRTLQRVEAKLAEEERHRLALDFAERSQKISVLKIKFESLCAKRRGSTDGEGGEPVSQAFFIMQAAQKREILQREGDELAGRIASAEKELKALAATLSYLNARNESFREAFHDVDPASNEASSVRALEAQVVEVSDSISKKRRDTVVVRAAIEESSRRLAALGDRVEELTQHVAAVEGELASARAEEESAIRISTSTAARVEDARARHRAQATAPTLDELAFSGQAAREIAAGMIYTLGQLASQAPSLEPTLAAALRERGMRVPARPPTRQPGVIRGSNSAALALAAAPAAPRAASASAPRAVSATAGLRSVPGTPSNQAARAPSPMVRQRPDAANTGKPPAGKAAPRPHPVKEAPSKVPRPAPPSAAGTLSLGISGQQMMGKRTV